MNKSIDNAYLNKYTDSVINRGYEIFDEWIDKKHDSRKIVASAENAVKLFKKRKSKVTFIDALAHLFALDTRIKEKYNTLFNCLLSYFSWRRETRALRDLKGMLNIPLGETDIRSVIAIEIEKVAEKLENEWEEDGDDETHGGKRNGQSEGEEATSEAKASETAEEATAEENLATEEAAEEAAEEKGQEATEETQTPDEATNEAEQTAEEAAEAPETAQAEEQVQEETVEVEQQEENNAPEEVTDKKEQGPAYNDAVDSPPLPVEKADKDSSQKISFIDEVIMDNMIKGKENIIGHNPLEDVRQEREAANEAKGQTEPSENADERDKNDFLYDEHMADINEATAQEDRQTEQKPVEQKHAEQKPVEQKHAEQKPVEQKPTEQTQQLGKTDAVKVDSESVREPLQVDITQNQENEMRRELQSSMTDAQIHAFIEGQKAAMREHMKIVELEYDAARENNVAKQEPVKMEQPINAPSRR